MRELLESGVTGLETVAHCLAQVDSMTNDEKLILMGAGILSPLGDVQLLAPIPNPKLILSVGLNYWKHLRKWLERLYQKTQRPSLKHGALFLGQATQYLCHLNARIC